MKNTLPNKLSYGDETSSGSGLMETKLVVNQLIDYLAELTEVVEWKQKGATIIANQYQEIPKYDGNAVSMTTHNTREVEEIVAELDFCLNAYKELEGHEALHFKNRLLNIVRNGIKETHHQELQKARQDWLREEITWLKNEHAHSFGETATTLETIIDRYLLELEGIAQK